MVFWALAMGVGRVTGGWSIVYCILFAQVIYIAYACTCSIKGCLASQWCDATDECDIW